MKQVIGLYYSALLTTIYIAIKTEKIKEKKNVVIMLRPSITKANRDFMLNYSSNDLTNKDTTHIKHIKRNPNAAIKACPSAYMRLDSK